MSGEEDVLSELVPVSSEAKVAPNVGISVDTLDPDLEPDETNQSGSYEQALDTSLHPGNDLLREGKSMENILLETSAMEESIDLGNNTFVDSQDLLDDSTEDIFSSMASVLAEESTTDDKRNSEVAEDTSAGTEPKTQPDTVTGSVDDIEETDKSDPPAGDISQYFQDTVTDSLDIFDSLSAATGEKLTIGEGTEEISETLEDEQDDGRIEKRVRVHLESHSSVNEEATTVDFEEEKGEQPLKPTPSTRSLARYFSTEGESTEEATSFFDTFTVGEDENSLGLSITGYSGIEQPIPESGMTVPETPPIPVGSPMPSPFHQLSAPTSATEPRSFFEDQQDSAQTTPTVTNADHLVPKAQFTVAENDDPFTLGLNISDIDRRYDAWIPSEMTRQVLITLMTSPAGTVTLQPEQITMPGIIHDESLGDPVRDLIQRYVGDVEAQKRTCLTGDSVAQDETGLRKLIKAECWRSAVDLTGKLLIQCGQGVEKVNTPTKHTPYTLQLWFCRLSLLMRLRLYAQTEAECEAFGNMDKPDLYYEYYQDKYAGRRGSMVPFGLRLIHAELPHHLGKTQESLDRIYYLIAIVKKIVSNLESGLAEDGSMLSLTDESRKASRELWERREIQLLYSVANCLFSIKDYNTTLSIFDELLMKYRENKCKILCTMARIYLQMGDTNSAKKLFTKAEASPNQSDLEAKCQHFMNMGFLSLGQSQFQEAYNNFKNARSLDKNNATALNNMAVCALYTGQLTDALDTLEDLVDSNPDLYLQEGILFNLCTLFELESSHAIFKKQKLLSMVNQTKGNGFNVACLKMV